MGERPPPAYRRRGVLGSIEAGAAIGFGDVLEEYDAEVSIQLSAFDRDSGEFYRSRFFEADDDGDHEH